jgi:ketosteroid isomerase-like protein
MSRENVETIERAYAVWKEAGVDAFLEYWAANAEWRSIPGDPVYRDPMHGKDAVRAYLEDWLDTFEDFGVEPVELIDVGEEQVVGTLRYSGRARHSDAKVDSLFAAVFVIRHGQIIGGGEYETQKQALEAAGLRE